MVLALHRHVAGNDTVKTSARFFRLSLRNLLLMIFVFCLWAAYHGRWIQQRRLARDWILDHQTGAWANADPDDVTTSKWVNGRMVQISTNVPLFSWSLRLLGERPIHFINLASASLRPSDLAMIDSLQSLFPEADGVHIEFPRKTDRWPPLDIESFVQKLPGNAAAAENAPLTPSSRPIN